MSAKSEKSMRFFSSFDNHVTYFISLCTFLFPVVWAVSNDPNSSSFFVACTWVERETGV